MPSTKRRTMHSSETQLSKALIKTEYPQDKCG